MSLAQPQVRRREDEFRVWPAFRLAIEQRGLTVSNCDADLQTWILQDVLESLHGPPNRTVNRWTPARYSL